MQDRPPEQQIERLAYFLLLRQGDTLTRKTSRCLIRRVQDLATSSYLEGVRDGMRVRSEQVWRGIESTN